MADVQIKQLNAKEIAKAARLAADETLVYVSAEIVRDAKQNAPIAFGNLRNSLATSRPFEDKGVRAITIGTAGGKEDEVRYATVVEKGRQRGKKPPPSKELEPWVEMKLGAGRTWKGKTGGAAYQRKGSRKMKNTQLRAKEIARVAFLVARKIGREGTKPRPFLMPAYDRFAGKIGQMYQRRFEARVQAAGLRPVTNHLR